MTNKTTMGRNLVTAMRTQAVLATARYRAAEQAVRRIERALPDVIDWVADVAGDVVWAANTGMQDAAPPGSELQIGVFTDRVPTTRDAGREAARVRDEVRVLLRDLAGLSDEDRETVTVRDVAARVYRMQVERSDRAPDGPGDEVPAPYDREEPLDPAAVHYDVRDW